MPFEAVAPRTPDGEVDAAGDVAVAGEVEAAGEVELEGDDDVLGAEEVDGVDECVADWTPLLVDGAVLDELFVVELLTVELFVTEVFVLLLLVTLVLVLELVLLLVLFDDEVEGVDGVDGVLVELQLELLKLFTACQSRMCRLLPGHAWTLCGWLLPGP